MNRFKQWLYHWMMMNFPHWVMYKHIHMDNQHKIWIPRWGWSKKQIADAKKRAKDLSDSLKFN